MTGPLIEQGLDLIISLVKRLSKRMSIKQQIEDKLTAELKPSYLAVVNESHMHAVPLNSETHFKVIIAASVFEEKRAVQRHQIIYGLLKGELEEGVHALALHTFTPEEWLSSGRAPESPECMGGEK